MDAIYAKIIEEVKADPEKAYTKALEYKTNADYTMWSMYMVMLANKGYKPAMDTLVDDYHNDNLHKKQDYDQTKGFYELTVKYSYSTNYLGYMYGNSRGVLEDKNKSKEYFEMSAAQGNLLGISNLGSYYTFKSTECDIIKGIQLNKIAAKKGEYYSAEYLARWYHDGHKFNDYVLKTNYKKAQKYAMIAIGNENCTIAYGILGRIYRFGKNGVKDALKAKEYFEKAITGGGPGSMCQLGHMYDKGEGIPEDKIAAEKMFKLCETTRKTLIKDGDFNRIEDLVNLYIGAGEYFDKQEIIAYFISINHKDELNRIFDVAQYYVNQSDENKRLKTQIVNLETENLALNNKLASVLNIVN